MEQIGRLRNLTDGFRVQGNGGHLKRALALLFLLATPLFAQQKTATVRNPLDQLHDQVKVVFERAGTPFTEEQEKAIAGMIEDRRQASEDLYGQLMDFRAGPVQGEQQDRAVAGIKWMNDEFAKHLVEYLTREQLPVWESYESGQGVQDLNQLIKDITGGSPAKQQTQFMRITNNAFTAEHGGYNGQPVNSEIVQRGGVGAFHGEGAVQFKNASLNARNPFADNKPPYKERQLNFNFSGPMLRNRFTLSAFANQNERQNVGTVHAITLAGPFDLGIVTPALDRSVGAGGTYQFSERNSVVFNMNFGTNSRKNQGIGGYTLPDRASNRQGHYLDLYGKQISVISNKTIYETNFEVYREYSETKPVTDAVSVDVLGAFSSGGAQNNNENDYHNFSLGNLFSRTGTKFTVRAGLSGSFRGSRSFSEANFLGNFVFTDLNAYLTATPQTFRVTRGEPLFINKQIETASFAETDIKLTRKLTAMFGVRYEWQTNLSDHNNAAPRVGFAYAIGGSTVIRSGVGIYYQRMWDWIVETQKRLDGSREYEIVINNPSYPDPFQNATATVVPPSTIRVTDPHIVAPYEMISSISLERTFKNNLFVSGKYEFKRGVHMFHSRDLNAPLPGQTTRPDSSRGITLNLESTGMSRSQIISLSVRQRFSIFNVNASYGYYSLYSDTDGPFSAPSDNYNLRSDWGRQTQPLHRFSTSVNSKLFLGLFLTGTVSANSGTPYNITTGMDDNFDTNFNDRPAGRRRNSAIGSGYLNFNFNVSKAIFFGGGGAAKNSGTNLNVFANMTNAFNHTNFGTPAGIVTSPFFGHPTSAQSAREIEVGLRFQF